MRTRRWRSRLSGGDSSNLTVLHTTSATSIARAQVLQYNLTQAGFKVTLKPQPFAVAIKTAGTKSQAQAGDFDMFLIGWLADYPDPFDFINVLMDGDNIQESNNYELRLPEQSDVQQADEAGCEAVRRRPLQGVRPARHRPDEERRSVGALSNGNTREFISNRITNYIYHPVYSGMIINAAAIK